MLAEIIYLLAMNVNFSKAIHSSFNLFAVVLSQLRVIYLHPTRKRSHMLN